MLPWIPIILESAPGVFALLGMIFRVLAFVPIVGPIFALLSLVFSAIGNSA